MSTPLSQADLDALTEHFFGQIVDRLHAQADARERRNAEIDRIAAVAYDTTKTHTERLDAALTLLAILR
jgi:hypothetical protein